jgi:hypothetical protein
MNYSAANKYHAQDFEITIPSAYQDRSVNVFLLGTKQPPDFNLVVSRDTLPSNLNINELVKKQLDSIASAQKKFEITNSKKDLKLNGNEVVVIASVEVGIKFLNQANIVYQRHAYIELESNKILMLVGTVMHKWKAEDDDTWNNVLQSLKLRNL